MKQTEQASTPAKRIFQAEAPVLLDYPALFNYYGLFKSTISKLVMHGNFTDVVKVGNKNYFKRTDVESWIESQTVAVG